MGGLFAGGVLGGNLDEDIFTILVVVLTPTLSGIWVGLVITAVFLVPGLFLRYLALKSAKIADVRELRVLDNKIQRELNYIIVNEWKPRLEYAKTIASEAYYKLGLFQEEYEELIKADKIFLSYTTKSQISLGMKIKFNDSKKMAIGVGILGAVIGVGVFALSKNVTKDFGYNGKYYIKK